MPATSQETRLSSTGGAHLGSCLRTEVIRKTNSVYLKRNILCQSMDDDEKNGTDWDSAWRDFSNKSQQSGSSTYTKTTRREGPRWV